ncbi:MAG: hypothetical protein Q7R76_07005 [Candidatus Woesearchaeota archaeon]|nr:hypothetical protein [Candidatus Woesearchaeota archaeon]
MEESLSNAREELKRVDHLIYVSLKYTRTCDIFKSIIQRLIDSLDNTLLAILKKFEDEKKIYEIPSQPGVRCSTIREHMTDEKVNELIEFYLLLRQINRAEFTRFREFRRHVTMTVNLAGEELEITIDRITEYYKRTREYIEHVDKTLHPEKVS